MNRFLSFILIALFSVFLGSQITEGSLLVPYWKTLTKTGFYNYYSEFGPTIGGFYTIQTIIAVLIPIGTSIYCYAKKTDALKYAIISTIFALSVIAMFYIYFKGTNELFYTRTLNSNQLKSTLNNWETWHWLRVFLEVLSLIFLIVTYTIIHRKNKI